MAHDRPVTLAAVVGAKGVMGEVRLKLFGEGVAALKRYRAFNDFGNDSGNDSGQGRTLTVQKLADDGKGGAIARFAEITDRTGAERLRGTALTVPRASLPALPAGEYYYADLIGLPAVSTTGEALGTCIAVENFGAGDVLEIERTAEEGAKPTRFMVPMKAESVPEWSDLKGLLIDAAWVE